MASGNIYITATHTAGIDLCFAYHDKFFRATGLARSLFLNQQLSSLKRLGAIKKIHLQFPNTFRQGFPRGELNIVFIVNADNVSLCSIVFLQTFKGCESVSERWDNVPISDARAIPDSFDSALAVFASVEREAGRLVSR